MSSVEDVVEIYEKETWEPNQPTAFIGVPGPGLVGPIACMHIIDSLKLKQIASVHTNLMPPVSLFHMGVLQHPLRIYGSDDGKYLVITSEISVPAESLFFISRKIIEWLMSKGVKVLVTLDGASIKGKPEIVYGIAEEEILNKLKEHKVIPLIKGYIGGMTGAIMNECIVRTEIDAFGLLAPLTVDEKIPDPKAAAMLIDKINHIFGLEIPIEKLLKEARMIEEKLRELAEKAKMVKEQEARKPAGTYFV
ncbi:MAG: proteasome assembly chaperone family protein [Candidatus Asgardarchaeia archaeon]